jgi:hypothetical protein
MLEYATIRFASPSCPTREGAFDEAFSQFLTSGIHITVNQLFSLSPRLYSTQQLTEFILMHRLR